MELRYLLRKCYRFDLVDVNVLWGNSTIKGRLSPPLRLFVALCLPSLTLLDRTPDLLWRQRHIVDADADGIEDGVGI